MPAEWVHNASPAVNALSEWPLIVGICISLTTLMTMTVGLRIYVRARMVRSVGIDDYIIIFSAICSILYSGICIGQSRWGLGLPIQLRPKINLDKYSEINFAGRPFYMAGITGFKVALCFAYLRITNSSHNSRYRIFIWSAMAFAALSHLAGTFVLLFQCSPMRKSWRPKTPGKCLPNAATFYALAAVTIFCDLIIFFTPIPLLTRIQIGTKKKIGLIAVFTLGAFTTVCSVMRMVQIITISKNGNSTMLVLWGTIETNVGIILTCLPCLTPLFTFLREKTRTATSSYRKNFYEKKKDNIYALQYRHQGTDHSTPLKNLSALSASVDIRSNSQENILPTQGRPQSQCITKTTTVEVKTCTAEKGSSERDRRWLMEM